MWTDHLKIGKVDGETIIADPDGTLHSVTKNADMVGKTTIFNKKRKHDRGIYRHKKGNDI